MREQLELVVVGVIADQVRQTIFDRFDHVTTQTMSGPVTVLMITDIDQAGERALLNLLWDTGHQIGSLSSCPTDQAGP